MTDLVADLEESVKDLTGDVLFVDSLKVTITYHLYRALDPAYEDLIDEDGYYSFFLTAVPSRKKLRHAPFNEQVAEQMTDRAYLVRESDLPGNLTSVDLSNDDRITHETTGQQLKIKDIDKTLGWIMEIVVQGE